MRLFDNLDLLIQSNYLFGLLLNIMNKHHLKSMDSTLKKIQLKIRFREFWIRFLSNAIHDYLLTMYLLLTCIYLLNCYLLGLTIILRNISKLRIIRKQFEFLLCYHLQSNISYKYIVSDILQYKKESMQQAKNSLQGTEANNTNPSESSSSSKAQQKSERQQKTEAELKNEQVQSNQFFYFHKGVAANKTNVKIPKPFNQSLHTQKRKSILDIEQVQRMRIPNDDIISKQEQKVSLAQSITCPICLMLLQVPYYECQGCMNGFCVICLESWWKKAPNSCAFKCTDVQFKLIKRSNTYNALIELLKVKCQYCRGQFTVADISNHIIKSCLEVSEFCRFCNQKLSRKVIQEHEKQKCTQRPWKCQHCNIQYLFRQRQQHDNVCSQKEFPCTNQGCEQKIKRKDKKNHQKNCNFKDQTCQWCNKPMKLKQYREHHNICEKKKVNCNWCNQILLLLQSNQHQIKCQLRKESCRLCHQMILSSQMQKHKPDCMFESLIDIKGKNQRLQIENVRLKQKIMILQGIIEQNITNNQSKTMRVVTDMKQQEKKYIEKDLLRIDNSIKSVQKLKKQQFAAHLRFPHIIQSWCPICRQLEKKFKAMLDPLLQQRKQVLIKISEIERYSYTPKPK